MLAHLSDLHVLAPREDRPQSAGLSMRLASLGRPLDPAERRRKVLRALGDARDAGAVHVVVTGDLTETGTADQFEALGEILHDGPFRPEHVTLVPGNHDGYTAPDAWRRALAGPLAAFRRTAADRPGKVVFAGGLALLPVDATIAQKLPRSAGELTEDAAHMLEWRLGDRALRDRPVAVVLHHPPFPRPTLPWQWVDGLQGYQRLAPLLQRFDRLHVLHGHLHYATDRGAGGRVRAFGATATVDDATGAPRVRFYAPLAGVVASVAGSRPLDAAA